MKLRKIITFVLYIIFILFSSEKYFSQSIVEPSVQIRDHNNNTKLITIDCDYNFLSGKKIELTSEFPEIRQPNSYKVDAISYTPIGNFTEGTVVDIKRDDGKKDDTFSNSIQLPFDFCFYGNKYSQILISDNGVVSFSTELKKGECPYAPTGPIPNGIPKNAIFGVFHDMLNIQEVRYYVEGTYPNRKVIVNYNNIPQYGYSLPNKGSTSQIVLYETSNIIDVYIKDRYKNESTNPIFDGVDAYRKNALVGLTNYDSSNGIAAPGRDSGNWDAHNEGWRFTPNGNTNTTIIWKYNGSEISGTRNKKVITVQPGGDTKYSVEVTYNICTPFKVKDEIEVKFSQDFPTAKEITTNGFCVDNNASYTIDLTEYEPDINSDKSLTFTYFESVDQDYNPVNPITTPTAFTYSNDKTIYVKVLKSGVCYILGKMNLKINKKPIIASNQYFEECDPDNDGKEIIKIKNYKFTGLNGTFHKVFDSLINAQQGEGEINEEAYNLDVSTSPDDTKTLYLRVWNSYYNDLECFTIVPFKIKLKKTIKLKEPEKPFSICDVIEGQTIKYDITQYESQLIDFPTTGITFEYYTNPNYASWSKINTPTSASITLNTIIYIKGTSKDYCEGFTKMELVAEDCSSGGSGGGGATGPGGPGGGGGAICDAKDTSYTVNLDQDYLRFYLPGGLTLDKIDVIGFYDSYDNSVISITTPYIYTFPVPFFKVITARYKIKSNGTETFVNFPISASAKSEIDPDIFDICDTYNDGLGKEKVQLVTKYEQIINNLYLNQATIRFFESHQDLLDYNNNNSLKNYITEVELSQPKTTIYVWVKFFNCIYEHEIYFNLIPIAQNELGPYSICDFDDDKKEKINILEKTDNETDLKNLLNSSQLTNLKTPIRYYKTIQEASINFPYGYISDPENFEINASQMSVWARLEIENECPIFVEIKFYFTTSVSLPNYKTELTPCADNTNQLMNFNLNEFIISTDVDSEISFYSQETAASIGDVSYLLGGGVYDGTTPLLYNVTQIPITIYMRIYDKNTQCVKVLPVKITLIPFPEIKNPIIKLCDYKNDKQEEVSTQFIQNQLISNNPSLSSPPAMAYKFFATEAEANANLTTSLTTFTATPTNSIWVRIIKNIGDCPIVFELKFSLTVPPKLNNENLVYTLCNNNTGNENGAVSEKVNLNNYRDAILGFPYTNDYIFSYYDTSEADAETGISGGVAANYTITSFPKTIWVKVKYTPTGCFSIKTLTFNQAPSLEKDIKDSEIIACAAGEMSKVVNLEDYPPQMIISPANLVDFEISYHTTRTNAVNNISITSDITNYTVTPASQIWIKFTDKRKEGYGCYIIKKLNVILHSTPKAQDIFPEICDESDGNLDGNFVISNLDNYSGLIIPGEDLTTINNLYPFTYYSTLKGAEEKDPVFLLNKTNYTFSETDLNLGVGSDPDFHIIYARIDKNDRTGCYSIVGISFLVNKKVPLIKNEITIEECDENDISNPGYNDGKSIFNLKSLEDQWINTSTFLPGSKIDFNYFVNKVDASLNQNPILDPSSYINSTPYTETVYVRISTDKYCDNIATIHLKVYPSILAEDHTVGDICKFEDGTGNEVTLDLTTPISCMQKNLKPEMIKDLHVTFFTNLADANKGLVGGAIPLGDLDTLTTAITAYLPAIGNTTIYVRFESRSQGCFSIKKIHINKLEAPKTKPVTYIICDDDLDDSYYIIPKELDTSGFITNPENYTLTYFISMTDAWKQTSELPNDQKYIITSFHTDIFARIVNKITGCINVETITIATNPKIAILNAEVELEVCDGDNDGYTYFDLALVNADIVNPLIENNVKFSYYSSLEDAQKKLNEITDFNMYQNLQSNIDNVYVRLDEMNSIGEKCPSLAKIKLKTYYPSNPLPKTIYLCPRIDSMELNGGNFDEWEWSYNGGIISTDRYYIVKDIGSYSLKVTKYLNYNLICTATFIVEVKPLEDPVIIELKAGDNYITVIAKGPQPLEYSIDNINWQKNNTFTNLESGIYTFYVRSTANGCEAITSKGIIFKVPNVITPNGDGFNDIWKLCGLNILNTPSHIKIFDRYGKMVFEQLSHDCFLWDGKYLGRNLPTTSYWYTISMADGRKFTGWILLRNYDETYR